jgi:hypothetical protein
VLGELRDLRSRQSFAVPRFLLGVSLEFGLGFAKTVLWAG